MALTDTQQRQVGEVAGDRQHGVQVLLASDLQCEHGKMLAALADGNDAAALAHLRAYAVAWSLRARIERAGRRADADTQTETE